MLHLGLWDVPLPVLSKHIRIFDVHEEFTVVIQYKFTVLLSKVCVNYYY